MPSVTIRMQAPGKGRPRFTRGRVYTPRATKEAEQCIAWKWIAANGRHPLSGAVRLSVEAVYSPPVSWSAKKRHAHFGQPKLTKPDGDNVIKLVGDALNGVAYDDDAQIRDASISKLWGPENLLTITVEAAE